MSEEPDMRAQARRSGLKFLGAGAALLAVSLAPSFFWRDPNVFVTTLAYVGVTGGAILVGIGAGALNRGRK